MVTNFWGTAAVPDHVNAANIDALVCFVISVDAPSNLVIGLGYADSASVFWTLYRTIFSYKTTKPPITVRLLLKRER